MTFERSALVENEFNQLSERRDRILQEKKDLEERKQKAHELGQNFKDKKHECQALGAQLFRLVNQNNSFSDESEGGHGLRDVGGEIRSTPSDTHMSWDFEGLNLNRTGPEASGDGDELVTKIEAQLEAEIHARERDLQLLEEQMKGQAQIEKHSDAVARGYSSDRLQNSNTVQLNVSAGGDGIFSSPSTKVHELQKQVEKLLENSQELNNRISVLTKQKEELLQVNHQWDDQYRQLKADKERLSSELRKRIGTRDSAEVQRQGRDTDEETRKLIQELTQKNEGLTQRVASLIEKRQQSDKLWVAAKKVISEEREGRAAAVQAAQAAEEQRKQLEHQLQNETQTQCFLKQEVERLACVSNPQNSAGGAQMVSQNVTEQIEMLKQQISVYADDFANERSDRERIQAEKEAQKERLKEFEREIALLKEQIRVYRDDFDKERRDKERIQRALRDRGVVQVQDEPWYMVPPNDYVTMRPVQRRQAVNQDRQYRYSPREIQELAFQQQQPLHPRGQAGHPGGVCHGCEADGCDVIDGNAILKCPRCERVFASNERRPFEEHIDKCTT